MQDITQEMLHLRVYFEKDSRNIRAAAVGKQGADKE